MDVRVRQFSLVVIILAGGCSGGLFGVTVTEPFEISQALPSGSSLSIDWGNGSVEVRIDESAETITASGTLRVSAPTEDEANLLLPGLQVRLETSAQDPDILELALEVPNVTSFAQFSADVQVIVPRSVTLAIGADNASVELHDNADTTTISVGNGDVDIFNQQDSLLAIEVVNGNVGVDTTGGDVQITVGNGSAAVAAAPPAGGTVSVIGGVTLVGVQVPVDFDAMLSLNSGNGIIQADLAMFDESDVITNQTTVSATLGAGGGLIEVVVQNGNILFEPLN